MHTQPVKHYMVKAKKIVNSLHIMMNMPMYIGLHHFPSITPLLVVVPDRMPPLLAVAGGGGWIS